MTKTGRKDKEVIILLRVISYCDVGNYEDCFLQRNILYERVKTTLCVTHQLCY